MNLHIYNNYIYPDSFETLLSVRKMFFLKDLKPQKKSYGNGGPKLKTYILGDDLYIPRTQMTHILEDLTRKMVPVKPAKRRSSKNHSLDPLIFRGLKCFLKQGSVLVLKIAFCLRDLRILWKKTPRNHHEIEKSPDMTDTWKIPNIWV